MFNQFYIEVCGANIMQLQIPYEMTFNYHHFNTMKSHYFSHPQVQPKYYMA